MKRKGKIFLFLTLALTMLTQGAQADKWDGITRTNPTEVEKLVYGEEGSEWLVINSAAELAYIHDHWDETSNTGWGPDYDKKFYKWNYVLNVDIDMSDWSWTPLGSDSYDGTFDGQGHTIRINIFGATDNYQGLFARISSDGKVHNLHVSGNIHCSASRLVGGIAGENDGTISNCWVSADVRSDWKNSSSAFTGKVGGIAGENNGTVEYCCMTGNVTNNDADVGGLVGDNSGATISHCTFYGSVSSTHAQDNKYAGDSGTENSCYDLLNQSEYDNANDKTMYRKAIQKPYAININNVGDGTYEAKIDETTVTGAYPGQTITLNKTSGTVYGVTIKDADGNKVSYSGEDVNQALTITMPHRDVNVTAIFYTTDWDSEALGTEANPYIIDKELEWNYFAEKVNGGKDFSGKYVKLTANITVTQADMVGCMVGTIRRSFNGHFDGGGNTINCQISADDLEVAPFRYTENATFKDLTLTGYVTISGEGHDGLGGVVAQATGNTTFTNCKVSTALTASAGVNAGGFVGAAEHVNFEYCTFDGKLLGNADYCGGFVGFTAGYSNVLNNCLFKSSEMSISANNCCTFVYQQDDNTTFNNCYYTQALGTAQGKKVYTTEPTHGFYTPITLFDSNTYYWVIGTEGESGGTKTYQTTEDTDVKSRIIVKGSVVLNLGEGTTLHATKGIELSADNNANLTIDGLGALTIDNCLRGKSGIGADKVGTLIIKGGTLNIQGGESAAAIGGDEHNTGGGSITINGGVVNAVGDFATGIGGGFGGEYSTICGDIVINGGQVKAIGDGVYGIGPSMKYPSGEYHSGTLTLSLTNPDDFVYISESNWVYTAQNLSSITIANGMTLYDEDGVAHTSGNVGYIFGKTLRPYDYRLELSDNADNSTAIAAAANDKLYNVTLSGRTLIKDGSWNTLCLPFSMNATQIAASDLAGATIKELEPTTSNLDANGTLTLKFATAYDPNEAPSGSIEAGKPYIVKWESTGSVSNPTFPGVIISCIAPTAVEFAIEGCSDVCQFVGQFSPFRIGDTSSGTFDGDVNEIVMMGSGNMMGYSQNARTLKCFRAHFNVPASPATGQQLARRFVMDFGDGSNETGILTVTNGSTETTASGIFTLDGRKLQAEPTQNGVYIVNGKKVIIK